jgi:hypothetical protein
VLNVHERNGDRIKIATLADFCGTRWQVNAVMIPTPAGRSYMMPVARVMSLYRWHTGREAVEVRSAPEGLDVTASRTADRIYLHVVNTCRTQPVSAHLEVEGLSVTAGRVFQIAADPEFEIMQTCPDALAPTCHPLPADVRWTFPAASVSAVELAVSEREPA